MRRGKPPRLTLAGTLVGMRALRFVLVGLLFVVFALGFGQDSRPAVVKSGDHLMVTVIGIPEYSGEFIVLSDGSISGPGFQRVVVSGKTLSEAQKAIVAALRAKLRNPEVNVFFRSQKPEVIYLVNVGGSTKSTQPAPTLVGGVVPFVPGMKLRQVMSGTGFAGRPDQMRLTVSRGQKVVLDASLADVLEPGQPQGDFAMEADDVVTLDFQPMVRVWTTGLVRSPGEFRVPVGADVYQAIALAGGVDPQLATDDTVIQIRRGPTTVAIPNRPVPGSPAEPLQPGDTIVVTTAPVTKVTIGGLVKLPGEITVKSPATIEAAVAKAGGADKEGTLANVVVVRGAEVFRVDATQLLKGQDPSPFRLQEGDVVYVRRNERVVSVIGQVRQPGVVFLPDEKQLRVSDVLARAGGVVERGSLRRVFLARSAAGGKIAVTELNLDDFMKKGHLTQNPVVQPDDVLLFGFPKNAVINDLSALLTPLILVNSLIRR